MPSLELIELYPSPWSERVRWAFEWKKVPYARRAYQPIAGEAEHKHTTGIATAPVLLADGKVVGDSNAALDWLETNQPSPPLLPADPRARAQVRAWEILATESLAPFARLSMIGQWKSLGIQPFADYFAQKYHWSPEEQERTTRLLGVLLPELSAALRLGPYLVGDTFTRADLTMACMLAAPLGHPPDEVFALDPGLRGMFGLPMAQEPAIAPLVAWRDGMYRLHRGGPVVPA